MTKAFLALALALGILVVLVVLIETAEGHREGRIRARLVDVSVVRAEAKRVSGRVRIWNRAGRARRIRCKVGVGALGAGILAADRTPRRRVPAGQIRRPRWAASIGLGRSNVYAVVLHCHD